MTGNRDVGREDATALRANLTAYDSVNEKRFIAGSPHLRHAVLRRRYDSLVESVIASVPARSSTLSVLEVGAGDGLASIPWLRRGVRLTAIDCSETMLELLKRRAASFKTTVRTQASDATAFFQTQQEQFDVICFISMLHHVPDYLTLLRTALPAVGLGGAMITFQDPLRYDLIPSTHHAANNLAFLAWRVTQGNISRGIKTRIRRARGVYSDEEPSDFEEYHVVRNGVDSDLIARTLEPHFMRVERGTYWSSQAPVFQWLGDRARLVSTFSIAAMGKTTDRTAS